MKKIGDFLLFEQKFIDYGETATAMVKIDDIISISEICEKHVGNCIILTTTLETTFIVAGNPEDVWIDLVKILGT